MPRVVLSPVPWKRSTTGDGGRQQPCVRISAPAMVLGDGQSFHWGRAREALGGQYLVVLQTWNRCCAEEEGSSEHGRWSHTHHVFPVSWCLIAVWKCVTRETTSPCVPYVTEHAATGRWALLVQLPVQVICLITLQLSSSQSSWLSGVRRCMPPC